MTTPLAKQADLHLAVQARAPTCPVALAIHRYLFEHGYADQAFLDAHTHGADAAAREGAARGRSTARPRKPASRPPPSSAWRSSTPRRRRRSCKCGWGQERNRNGGSSSMAILALPAVAGKFGVRGGGYAMSNTNAWGIERTWIRAQEPATRLVNMNHLGRALTEYRDPPVQGCCSSTTRTPPSRRRNQTQVLQGLEREDLFTVVFDQTMTDTARYADVRAAGDDVPRRLRPAARLRPDQPAARHAGRSSRWANRGRNADVFGELLQRLDLGEDGDPQRRAGGDARRAVAAAGSGRRASCATYGAATPPYDGRPIQFVDVFPWTPDGKVRPVPGGLDADAPAGLYGYQPDPATDAIPAGADLAGERSRRSRPRWPSCRGPRCGC